MAGDMKDALPIPVIQAAIEGDGEALASVVKHYQGYIRYLAMRPLKDEYGNEYLCVDEDMRLRLERSMLAMSANA